MYCTNGLLICLTALISLVSSHPLHVLHAHHHHHAHHHLHLRLPFSSSTPKPGPELQRPLANDPSPASDTSDVYVNMTVKSPESSAPTSFLLPLRPSNTLATVELTSSVFHHPRTAQISNLQYGVAPKESSRQFERSGDVVCYAHTQSPASPQPQRGNEQKEQTPLAFRKSDGEIDFAEAGGR
ncbi:MAG: hypothetical protein Q9211_005801, partial [Gyalolechia sp. 1 TL-2023]